MISNPIGVQHAPSSQCHLLKTYHSTVICYDVNFNLDHEDNPEIPALLFLVEGGGLLVPSQAPRLDQNVPDQFVFPVLITKLEGDQHALSDTASDLYICPQRKNMDVSICFDRKYIGNWEKFTF